MAEPGRFYQKLVKNAGFNLGGFFLTFLLNFLTLPYIVRELGKSAYGVLALTGAVLGYLAFLDIGMSNALIKYAAESHARGERERVRRQVNTALVSNGLMGVAGAGTLYFSAEWLAERVLHVPAGLIPATTVVFKITSVTFFLNMVSSVTGAVPSALQLFFISNLIRLVYGVVNIVATVLVLYVGYSIREVTIAGASVALILMICNLWVVTRILDGYRPRFEFDFGEFAAMFRFGAFSLIHRVNSIFLFQLDRFLIGLFLPISEVTFYVIPATFSGYIMRIPQIILQVMFPLVSEIKAVHGDAGGALKKIHIRASKYLILYNLPLTVLTIVFARPILAHWMDPDTAARGARTMMLLAAAYMTASLAFVPGTILNGIGKPEVNAYISVATGVLNLALCLVLIPRYGIEGAGYAVLASIAATVPFFVIWVQSRYIGAGFREYLSGTFARPTAAGILTGAALYYFAPKAPGLPELLVYCAAYAVVFFAACLAAGVFDREDKDRFFSLIDKYLKRL